MKSLLAFALLSIILVLPGAYASTASIEVNGNTHEITYEATGLTVEGLEADTSTATLSVLVTTTEVEGTLVITLDRAFFDSRTDGADDDFLILADTEEAVFVEEKSDSSRTLAITVPVGTNSVDIISLGTTNFGTGQPVAEETPEEIPETTEETPTEPEPTEEPTTLCGPGTVLDPQTNACVLEATPEPTEEPAPVEETPETPEASESQQCGPGTVLKDGQCILDETCGPGTILKDGQCVLDTSAPTSSSTSMGKEFIVGIFAAFIIAFVVMIILWAIGRAGRRKN
ncbi:hypothetical protein [Candidatus Nitrosotenuis aquarius]|uniref:hypothetical protein n=1 Tax=Candidatus Nitrosotenuis aquarius TaxID=1846278 RepID=UPI000C1E3B82|nr:hypothetical protein [Candidatus Nitrosotenuis aquarius]